MFVCPECGGSQAQSGTCPNDGHPFLDRGEDLLLGQTVGAYRVARLLGLGGMGRVYKGVHPQIGSRVAIKVLSRECADRKDLVDRFFAEARAVNLIRHESIVNVLDLAMLPDGRPYIVMEYLDGAPLSDLIARMGAMPLGGVVRLAMEVLEALGAAHGKSIVHRDLKPDNIYVTPAGRPKVLDFGIAKLLPELGGSYTQTGSLLGTPHYMAPEQALGRPVDHRTDIYSMGVIVYECVTGQRPFNADSLFDLLRKHVDEAPVPPHVLRPDLPPAMEGVILAAMAKDPNQRFASAAAMAQALLQTAQPLPAHAWAPITPATAAIAAQRLPSGVPPSGAGWTPHSPMPPTPPPPYQGQAATAPTAHVAGMQAHGLTPAQMQHPQPTAQGYAKPPPPSPYTPPQAGYAPPHQGTPTTATAGQVVPGRAAAKARSRAPLFAVLAVVLVGGGVTAGVLASRSGNDRATPAGPGSGSAIAIAGSAPDPAVVPAPGGPTPTEPVPAEAAVEDDDDDDADVDVDVPAITVVKPGKGGQPLFDPQMLEAVKHAPPETRRQMREQIKAARAQIEANLAQLPADVRAQMTDLLKEYKTLEAALADGAPGTTAIADDPVADPATGGTGGGARPTPPPLTGPVESRTLPKPSGWNPAKIDVTATLKIAIAAAKQYVDPDARLFRIDADGVSPDGTADLTLQDGFYVDYRFISPARSKRPPGVKVGVKVNYECMFRVMIDKDSIELRGMSGWECDEPNIRLPKCSAKQVWKTALDRGANKDAVGSLGYRAGGGDKPTWYFGIAGTSFSEMWLDDC